MIQINCTNCKALLQIDDAFAGGVCRCRHCGTIQTVPKHLKESNGDAGGVSAAAAAVGSGKAAKTLYQKKRGVVDPGGAGSGTGLDDLAGIVASSGLSSSRLRKKEGTAAPAGANATAPPKDRRLVTILASAGGVIALLLGIIIYMAVRDKTGGGDAGGGGGGGSAQTDNTGVVGGSGTGTDGNANANAAVNPPTRNALPNFLGQPLNEKSVVYVLDRGAASQTEGRLDLLKQALLRSVRSLGPERKFAVVCWYVDGTKPLSYPATGLKQATPASLEELQKFLDDVYGVGQTKMSASIDKAFKTGAEAVVLVPIKTFLDEGFHPAVMKTRGKGTAKVYCVTLGQPDLAPQLKKIATETKGAYRDVSMAEVRAAATATAGP